MGAVLAFIVLAVLGILATRPLLWPPQLAPHGWNRRACGLALALVLLLPTIVVPGASQAQLPPPPPVPSGPPDGLPPYGPLLGSLPAPDTSACWPYKDVGYGGAPGTYHTYSSAGTDARPSDTCLSIPAPGNAVTCATATLVQILNDDPDAERTLDRAVACNVGTDGEYEYGINAAYLQVRSDSIPYGAVDEYDGTFYPFPRGGGTRACFGPESNEHHNTDTVIHVLDAVGGANVEFTVAMDWSRAPGNGGPGNDAGSEGECGDGVIEPCLEGTREPIGGGMARSGIPPDDLTLSSALLMQELVGCNHLDYASAVPAGADPCVVASGVANCWSATQHGFSNLADVGGSYWHGGANGAITVFITPTMNEGCSRSTTTGGWVWSDTTYAPAKNPTLIKTSACLNDPLQAQADLNGDGYGDEWFQPYTNYAQELVDRLSDPENNFEGDGLTSINEFRWLTIPIGPIFGLFPNAQDYDNDHFRDGAEVNYWNDSSNDPKLDPNGPSLPGVAVIDPDYSQNYDTDDLTTTHDPDSDDDGLLDGDEFSLYRSYPEFVDSDCASKTACKSPAQQGTTWNAQADPNRPGTGDNMTDPEELAKWNLFGPEAWKTDYDRDGIASNLLDPDADADDALDGDEFHCLTFNATNPRVGACTRADLPDTDLDGLLDGAAEALAGTDPLHPDTDADGLPDGWEYRYHLNPLDASDAGMDVDNDGLSNLDEYSYRCSVTPCPASPIHWSDLDPLNPDTEGDALLDGEELAWTADPLNPDSDYDGLRDGEEVHAHSTSPTARDSDDDGLTDYQEVIVYRLQMPDPNRANTDGSGNNTNDDTLSDYQEIIQYRTNVTNWDTDGDGAADGRDARPLSYDAAPTRVDLSPAQNPVQPRQEAYVIFREEGYVDVMVQDAHGAEGDIQSVDVSVRLDGTVNGAGGYVTIHQDAQRLDDGALWGARIGLPSRMSQATSESFALTVVGASGNVVSYTGTASIPMNAVSWEDDLDPASEWSHIIVHDSPGNAPTGSMGFSADIPRSVDPWNLSVEELFAQYGNFAVYRLKPFALAEEALSLLPDSSAYAKLRTITVSVENSTGADLSEAGWDITLWEDAFELVNPAEEPGVYASMASGGPSYFRTPKWLRAGLLTAWDGTKTAGAWIGEESVAQGASFLFGTDDPRAKGRLSGDIVSGFLVYGDVRDMIVGTIQDDNLKAGLGTLGVGLTFVGPEADGPYSVVKANIKLIAGAGPAGKRLALLILNSLKTRVAANPGGALDALKAVFKETSWLRRNTDKIPDYERARNVLPQEAIDAFDGNLDNLADLSRGLSTHPQIGEQAAQETLLRAHRATQLGEADETLMKVTEFYKFGADSVGKEGIVAGDPEKAAKALTKFADTPGVAGWRETFIKNANSGRVNEALRYEELVDQGALLEVHKVLPTFAYKGKTYEKVEADAIVRIGSEPVWTEIAKGHLGPNKAEQLPRLVAGVMHDSTVVKKLYYRIGPEGRIFPEFDAAAKKAVAEEELIIHVMRNDGSPVWTYSR